MSDEFHELIDAVEAVIGPDYPAGEDTIKVTLPANVWNRLVIAWEDAANENEQGE